MSTACQIVVCGSIVPDPLQTLEPVASPTGPADCLRQRFEFNRRWTLINRDFFRCELHEYP
jgi:hypothetical protein